MKCPHCSVSIHPSFSETYINQGSPVGTENRANTSWRVWHMECPSCNKGILRLLKFRGSSEEKKILIYPQNNGLITAPSEVPDALANDFNEAGAVLTLSPKSSAALSRRCLQHLLKLQGFNQGDLVRAIEAAIPTLPSHLSVSLDAVRNIGNFAAHPIKDKNSGEIVEVEPEEAEWNLEVLSALFDYYYVQPSINKARIDALNKKLEATNKPLISQIA